MKSVFGGKKILSILGGLLLTFVFVSTASAVENWRLSGNYTITFTCTAGCGGNYVHTMNVALYDNNNGTFSGTGYYNTTPSITWTVTGDVTGDTIGFLVDYNGSAYYVDADGTIATDGAMAGTAVSATQAFNWVMSPKATFYRYAEITSPTADSIVIDTLNLGAFLMDNDYDSVQWAVRKGTCNMATNTKMGNVDGFSDPYTWTADGSIQYKYNFSASKDVTLWEEGEYCFIFNPSEDGGESDIRMTELFKVNWDEDNDGVYDNSDKCLDSENDDPTEGLGTNRWIFKDGDWYTKLPKATVGTTASEPYDTYGCSCTQILGSMSETTGLDFGGHYKFGCSKSILEDWNRGTYHIGPTFIETVNVPANSSTGVQSLATLETGKGYLLKAYSTAYACNQPGCIINFDAEYSTSDLGSTWVDGVAAPYNSYGLNLLDLKVDDNFVDWGGYASSHTYQIPYAGTGNLLSLFIYDLAGSHFNNSGSILVDIIEDWWVNLW